MKSSAWIAVLGGRPAYQAQRRQRDRQRETDERRRKRPRTARKSFEYLRQRAFVSLLVVRDESGFIADIEHVEHDRATIGNQLGPDRSGNHRRDDCERWRARARPEGRVGSRQRRFAARERANAGLPRPPACVEESTSMATTPMRRSATSGLASLARSGRSDAVSSGTATPTMAAISQVACAHRMR